MASTFEIRRRAEVPPQPGPSVHSPELDDCFRRWRTANAALRAADESPVPPDMIRTLAIEVVRARNRLTRAQMAEGWLPSAATIEDLYRDEQLIQEADERPH